MVKMLLGDRDLQEKYSILISYVFLQNFQDFPRAFSFVLFFPGLFQAWIFSVSFSRFSRVRGNPVQVIKNLQHVIN